MCNCAAPVNLGRFSFECVGSRHVSPSLAVLTATLWVMEGRQSVLWLGTGLQTLAEFYTEGWI